MVQVFDMPISESQINENARVVDQIAGLLAIVNNQRDNAKLQQLAQQVKQSLTAANLFIDLDSKAKELEALIQAGLKSAQFEQDLQHWIADYLAHYEELGAEATKKNRELFANQPLGITHYLLHWGMVVPEVWGDSNDIRVVLKNVMTEPEDINAAGTYILPPIAIVPGPHATQAEKNNPHQALQDYIETVKQRNPFRDITLVMQVNSSDGHWLAARIDLSSNKIQRAELWDSMSTTSVAMRETPAYANMQKAVQNISPGVMVNAVAAGVQKDGSTCMQRSLQRVLQVKYSGNAAIDPQLKEIRDAERVDQLRDAVVKKIVANVPAIQVKKAAQPISQAKQVFQEELVAKNEKLENKVFHSLANVGQAQGAELKELKDYQIHFDEIMAHRLSELYCDPAQRKKPEEQLLQYAWSYAYKTMQYNLGLFKTPPAEQKNEPRGVKCNHRST